MGSKFISSLYNRRIFSLVVVCSLGLTYLFQNCSGSFTLPGHAPHPTSETVTTVRGSETNQIPATSPTFAPQSIVAAGVPAVESGNGTGYDGKVYAVQGPCDGNPRSTQDAILVTTSKFFRTVASCRPVNPPTEIPAPTIFNLTENSLVYSEQTYFSIALLVSQLVDDFQSAGVHVWIKPSHAQSAIVECWGAGGGGGDGFMMYAGEPLSDVYGGGGGGGGYSRMQIALSSLASNVNVTIGSGGLPGTPGGNSSFGSHVTAFGGQSGTAAIDDGFGNVGGAEPGVGGFGNIESGRSGSGPDGGRPGGDDGIDPLAGVRGSRGKFPGGGSGGLSSNSNGNVGAGGRCIIRYN